MFDKIKERLVAMLAAWAVKALTVENLRAVLSQFVEGLKEKAADTENIIDDWAIEFLEMIVASDEKMAILSDFIKGKLASITMCEATEFRLDEYGELAAELTLKTRVCASVVSWVSIAQLLQIVVPILVDFFAKKEVNQTSKVA
ncbi:MAG: hypothetical protein Q4D38_14445 [Planctomycetia bacterium]|nr:hypothetical protein [Planctomycetia bacterium]